MLAKKTDMIPAVENKRTHYHKIKFIFLNIFFSYSSHPNLSIVNIFS